MTINFSEIKLTPNLLSIFRLLLIIPLIYVFQNIINPITRNFYLIVIILIAFLSDILDGYIARKYNKISEFGKIIDPLADKIVVSTIIIFFWILNLVPTFYFVIILLRDLLILIGSYYLNKKTKKVLMSDIIGKITVFTIGLFFISILTFHNKNHFIQNILLYLSTIMCFVSLINYSIKSIKILKKL